MASDASTLDSSKQDSRARKPAFYRLTTSRHCAFFQRVAQSNSAQAELMKSSTIKLDESLKLLAEVRDLLRR